MNRVLCVVIIALLVACGALSLGLNHYRDNAITYKEQRDKKVSELEQANATITDMQQRQRDVAALDARYSRELADARAENETLRADVAAGRKRLRINATCPGTRYQNCEIWFCAPSVFSAGAAGVRCSG